MSVNEYDYDHALEALEKRRVEEATKRDEAQKVTEQHRKNEAAFAAAAELLQMHKDTGINLTQSFRLERFVNIFLGAANVWDGVRDNGA